MRSRVPLLLALIGLCVCSMSSVLAQGVVTATSERQAFYHFWEIGGKESSGRFMRVGEAVNATLVSGGSVKGTVKIARRQMPIDEYEETLKHLKLVLTPAVQSALLGQYDLLMEFLAVNQEQAQLMFDLPEDMAARVKGNELYMEEVADAVVEWMVWYILLENWHTYVKESVLEKDTLPDDQELPFDPYTAKEDLEKVYASLAESAVEITRKNERLFNEMLANVERDTQNQEDYDDWLRDRERAMLEFARNWQRRYDGSEIVIDDTIYLVRNKAEAPERGAEDPLKESLPRNGVLIEVPKARLVTPFDLINEDGSLKTAK